jgi:hypothetical protein
MFGSFNPEHLERYAQLAAERVGVDFAEEGTYDFTRCVRPDGSVYGTGGQCRKGTEEAKTDEKLTVAALKKLKKKAEDHALDAIDMTREDLKESDITMSWYKRNSGTLVLNLEESGDWGNGPSADYATISPKGRLVLLNPEV